jgi:hypothetical protein
LGTGDPMCRKKLSSSSQLRSYLPPSFAGLGMEPGASKMADELSTTGLHPQPHHIFLANDKCLVVCVIVFDTAALQCLSTFPCHTLWAGGSRPVQGNWRWT